MKLDVIGYVNILIGITDILLGVFVWQGNKKNSINKAYMFCTLTMGLWSISLYFYNNPLWLDPQSWLKVVYVFAYLMTISQINFAIKYNKTDKKIFSQILLYLIGGGLIYGAYLLLIKDSVVISVQNQLFLSEATMGSDYILYALPIFLSLFFLFSTFIVTGKKLTGIAKRQTQLYWVGGLFMIVPLFIVDFILPIFFNNTLLYKYSALGNILWSIFIGYSIVNTRFLDVRLVLGNLIKVLFKTMFISGLFVLILFVLIPRWSFTNDLRSFLLSIPISLILALFLSSFIKSSDKFIENNLIYSAYNPIEELQKYSNSNANTLSVSDIITNTKKSLLDALSPKKVYVSIISKKTKKEYLSHQSEKNQIMKDDFNKFHRNWEGLNSYRILIYSEIKNSKDSGKKIIDTRKKAIINFMAKYDIEIIVPIQNNTMITGLIMLSEKLDNSIYTLGDINFIESIAQNMGLRIGQAILYNEVQSLNSSLKQKVSEQTKELQEKVKQLEEARRKEADMIDIMGHELRTPMSIVKLNTDLLHNLTENVIKKKEDFVKYVTRIRNAVETEIVLINTLLSSAKLEGDKIDLNPTKVDIVEQIKMAIHAQETRAKRKGIQLITQYDPKAQNVYADHARTVEIVSNLIDNAVKYTQKGYVKVTTQDEGDYIRVSVIDTGMGISQEDLDRLGTKFFRTSNYIHSEYSDDIDIVRPGGSGLGLYVVFNLVKKMGGEIHVESELGEGSNFTFALPKYSGQRSNDNGDNTKDMFERLGLKKEENIKDNLQQ